MKHRSVTFVVAVLAPLMFSFAFAQDIYIPVVPQMPHILHTSMDKIQLTLSLFMLAVGAGQLFFGPLSDTIGRKRIALIGSGLFFIGAMIAAMTSSIDVLIFARILQGFGGCASMVVAFAIGRDLFSGRAAGRMFSYLNACIAASPIFAPAIGAFLDKLFGWRGTFGGLAALGLIGFLMVWWLINETHPKEKRLPFSWSIFKRYGQILRNGQFVGFILPLCGAMSVFFTWFACSSIIIISLLHVSEIHYGFYFGIIGVGFLLGSAFSGKIIDCIGVFNTTLLGCILAVISGLVMLIIYLTFGLSIAGFLIPMTLCAIAGALIFGSSAAGALEPMGEMAGSASAMMGSSEFIIAAVVASVALHWKVTSTLPLSIVMIVMNAIGLMALLTLARKKPVDQPLSR